MMGKILNILHVIPSLAQVHGGTTSSVLEMIEGLVEQGLQCDIALSDDDGTGRRLPADAPARQMVGRYYFPKYLDFYTYTPDMAPWLRARVSAYDLVHIHGLFSHVNSMAGRICKKHDIPYIVTPHGMANRFGMRHKPLRKFWSFRLIERSLLEHARLIHLTSRAEERDFSDLAINAGTKVIPLAVAPVPEGDPGAFQPDISVTPRDHLCLFMGRLDPVKNLDAVLDALAMPGLENFHLLVCGEGNRDYVSSLRARAKHLRIEDRITWLGFISGARKADVFAAADIFVQPSFSESFGMAALEALSAGLPCVLSRYVANVDDLSRADLAIPVGTSARSVAAGLVSASEWKTASFQKRAREHVTSCFDRLNISTAMKEMYQHAIHSAHLTGADRS